MYQAIKHKQIAVEQLLILEMVELNQLQDLVLNLTLYGLKNEMELETIIYKIL